MDDPRLPVLFLGSYAFAEEVEDLIPETVEWQTAGFVENFDRSRCGMQLNGKPIHWVDDLGTVGRGHHLICAIGTTKRQGYIEQVEPFGLPFATLVHPSARISATSQIGAGAIVSAGVIVAAQSEIGAHAILNRGVMIGHHTRIGRCVTVSPGANIAGKCVIEGGRGSEHAATPLAASPYRSTGADAASRRSASHLDRRAARTCPRPLTNR